MTEVNIVNINIIYFISELPAPLIIMIIGIIIWKNPPQFGEDFGYRTKLSQKSEQMWFIAQAAYGKLSAIVFAAVTAATVLLNVFAIIKNFGENTGFAVFIVQNAVVLTALFMTIAAVERKLKSIERF